MQRQVYQKTQGPLSMIASVQDATIVILRNINLQSILKRVNEKKGTYISLIIHFAIINLRWIRYAAIRLYCGKILQIKLIKKYNKTPQNEQKNTIKRTAP